MLRNYFHCPTQLRQEFITKINFLHLVCLSYKYYGIIKVHGGSVFRDIHEYPFPANLHSDKYETAFFLTASERIHETTFPYTINNNFH